MALQVHARPDRQLSPSGPLPPAHRPSALWLALELVRTIGSFALLAAVVLAVLLIVNFTTSAGQLSQRLDGAWQQTQRSIASASQAVADTFNPSHPPRYAIAQDTEFSSLATFRTADSIGDSADYQFTLGAIRRRDDASGGPDFTQYALLNRRYKVPHETKILGLTVRVDRGEQQFVLDRGVSFRIGSKLYKVNWISATDQQAGIAVYRSPDQFAGQLAFDSA